MLYITGKLKRVKILRFIASCILFIPRLPAIMFYYLGRFSEVVDGYITDKYYSFEKYLVKLFKWDDVAKEQFKNNPEKFDK